MCIVVWYSLCVVCCLLFVDICLCVLVVVRCVLCVVFVVRCLMVVGCRCLWCVV